MEGVKRYLENVEPRTAALFTGAACMIGTVVVLLQKGYTHREAKAKIQKAQNRRTDSLQRAEHAVLQYNKSHPETDSALILTLSLSEVTKKLQEGSLNPEEVFYSYMEKTLDLNKDLNCCTGILLESFDQLKTLDSNRKGLLYGVPVSIKENYGYKNYDSSCGVVINLEHPAKKDSVLVEVLKKQGAIPFVKTNIPQALLSYECSNPIFGPTLNPTTPRRPAAVPPPTPGRLSSRGLSSIYRGQKSVPSCPGPMARDVDSLALCMQALLCDHMFSLDPTVPPVPFNAQIYQSSKPLRIGYLETDGYTQPSPSMARSVREVKALLEAAGHTLVPYRHLNLEYVLTELVVKGILADGATTLLQKLEGSPVDPSLRPQIVPYALPIWLKKTLSFLLKPFSTRASAVLGGLCGVGSIQDLWKQHAAVEDYIQETIAEWRKCNIDALLCPVVGPAYNHLYCGKLTTASSYTILFNLLQFPAGVVPVSTVKAEDEEELKHYKGVYQDQWDKLFKQAVCGGEGLPVGVQCVTLPWQDELCLRLMKEVEQLVKQSKA
ncbi:Fatty-acid amide hydrolase 1 [Dissostichus eleginoides]|uniref:Fatty-acid amide hydrolase 1 n=1 Tax=Dissostichus eleginoides TaxID=100907 RepID=A0AAD9FD02_DISEL|nr:Fatty-acid amide hydrolase 1 [Dissostichus eleginoides]